MTLFYILSSVEHYKSNFEDFLDKILCNVTEDVNLIEGDFLDDDILCFIEKLISNNQNQNGVQIRFIKNIDSKFLFYCDSNIEWLKSNYSKYEKIFFILYNETFEVSKINEFISNNNIQYELIN